MKVYMKGCVLCCILFAASSLFSQPQWKEVYKSPVSIQFIKINRPIDNSISPTITVTQGSDTSYWNGPFCIRYFPATGIIDTVGNDECSSFDYFQNNEFRDAECNYTIWVNDAPYDTSRHLVSTVHEGISGDQDPYSPSGYADQATDTKTIGLAGSSIFGSCVITNQSNDGGIWSDYPCAFPQYVYTNQFVFFHPNDGTILFGLTDSGLAEIHFDTCPENLSRWQIIKRDSSPNFFYIAQDDPRIMFLGAQDTLWHSSDGGITWGVSALTSVNAMAHLFHTNIYAAISADSLSKGLYLSTDEGKGFLPANHIPVYSIDADQTSGTIYAGTKSAILHWNIGNIPLSVFDSIPGGGNIIGIAAIDGKIIYADSGGIYETDAPTHVQESVLLDDKIAIENYPNPFSSSTTLVLNSSGNVSSVKIYDVFGRQVVDLSNQKSSNVIVFNGDDLPAGIYVCQVVAKEQLVNKFLILLR